MSLATPDQQSISSEEDEEEGTGRQREFTTGSSDDEESSLSDRRFKLTSEGKRQGDSDIGENIEQGMQENNVTIVLGMIAWRSEFSTDEDLSGVSRGSESHWNKNSSNNTKEDWADFSTFSTTFGKPADRSANTALTFIQAV